MKRKNKCTLKVIKFYIEFYKHFGILECLWEIRFIKSKFESEAFQKVIAFLDYLNVQS